MKSLNCQNRSRPCRATIATLLTFAGVCASPSLVLAHPPLPNTPMDAANTTSTAIVCIAVICVPEFLFLNRIVTIQYRKGRKINESQTQIGIVIVMIMTSLLLWRLEGPPTYATAAAANAAAHVDLPAHGGQIQSIGENHVEAIVRTDLSVAVYISGIMPNIPFAIKQTTLFGDVVQQRPGDSGAGAMTKILLHAEASASDTAMAQASVFAGQIPVTLQDGTAPVTLTLSIPLGGKDHKVTFTIKPGDAASGPTVEPSQPHDTSATKVVSTPVTPEEKALFLTPGGTYTNSDIAANGATTPAQRFGSQMANHHLNPKKGAIICPITMTQANPKFPWVVGGRKYLFCCPPCIAEFVKNAKTNAKGLKLPENYVQK